MAEIDGQYEGPSVTRALARSKYKKSMASKEEPAMENNEGAGSDQAVEHLSKVHPHAKDASKSFHVYQHPDGKHHAHAHDHEAGTHEHREHPDMHSAMQHGMEHMGGGHAEPDGDEMATAQPMGGMEQLGMEG